MSSPKPNRSSNSRSRSRPPSEVTRAPWKSTLNLPLNESSKGCSCLSPTAAPPPHRPNLIQTRVHQGFYDILANCYFTEKMEIRDQMHDAGLHQGLGKHRGDRLGKALEPIDHRDQDVLGPAVTQLGHHPQPEFRPFSLLDPQPQDFLVARATHPDRQVNRSVVDHAFVADLYPQRVEEHDGVGRFQPAALPPGDLFEHPIGYRPHQVR